uniref:Malonyl-CoA:ACP transacylase (MAT) domain-containing protein n=1 Tax=Noctiluca scintillans TaxID=2966 RepID=A0A7S1F2S7_NOCSC|mmetsp:Transcript_27570/g.72673  ORF Transcript_27570/g.72673 Transcript_27570/m.72673 type:complete len:510 (+) Transcript_27570:92-1621(+)|eukprot:CAMPEP_0194531888 /NCGR_PEP_ID=MMETSP0253-20130528/69272_1 /TAXON_ID=2966 /ORGANISM="Noctiluca scintillans" /LENGTH=509 /DNA_ID=CAMNT_0039377275 /DNA_START=67 /DNA_END=1596 /DNA_ORIENTATION=+
MPGVKPATSDSREGVEKKPIYDYEQSWLSIPFQTYEGMTQQAFQDATAPFSRYGKNVPIVVPKGWRRVEGSLPGKHFYVHVDTGTISSFPKEIYDPRRECWMTKDGDKIAFEELESEERHLSEAYKTAKGLLKYVPEEQRGKESQALAKAEAHVFSRIPAVVGLREPAVVIEATAKDAVLLPVPEEIVQVEPVLPSEPPLPVALLFPGQGSQYVKMLTNVKDMPAVRGYLIQAEEILGYSLLELCLKGPESRLELTQHCQPAMFVAGFAAVEKLKADKPECVERVQAVCGLSLGEYTALGVAGVFTFEAGLKLVKLRGELMQEAASASAQSMLSVAGLTQEKLSSLCEEARSESGAEVCQIANVFFPNGFSCAGNAAAVELLQRKVTAAKCLQAKLLKTSGGFHTALMEPAKARLLAALQDLSREMKPPRCDVYMNASGQRIGPATPASEIVRLLGEQLTNCVLWESCVRNMVRDGVTEFYECGPMKQLKAMMKRIDPEAFQRTTIVDV